MFNTVISKDSVQLNLAATTGDDIFTHYPQLGFLSVLLAEGEVTQQGNIVTIPHAHVAQCSAYQLKTLALPELCPHIFSCQSTGTLLRDNYKIIALFKSKRGLPLGKFTRNGAFVTIAGVDYTLPYPIYRSLKLIALINDPAYHQQKLQHIKQLKEVIPFAALKKDASLVETEIIVPTRFTLDIVDSDNFRMTPAFLEQDGDSHTDILPQAHAQTYSKKFQQYAQVKDRTQVAYNKFVVLNSDMHKVISLVKEAEKKSISERRALFINPSAYIVNCLGEDYRQEVHDLFISTPNYISARISHVGIWHPKTQVFLPTQKSEWMPKDCVGIALDKQYVLVRPEKLAEVVSDLSQAIADGKPDITVDEQKVAATQENLDIIEQVNDKVKSTCEDMPAATGEEEEGKPEKIVAIIKDNIEGSAYHDHTTHRQPQQEYMPEVLKTSNLYPHQVQGIHWLQQAWNENKRGVLLADDMGLGKTLQVLVFLAWLRQLIDEGQLKHAPLLVVGPTSLLKNWQAEHDQHLHGDGLGLLCEAYGKQVRQLKNMSGKEAVDYLTSMNWVLTTYETLAQNENIFRRVEWLVIAFDECQAIKNPAAFRTDMAKAMAADFSIGITGTPVENSLGDLWCISDTMYPGLLGTYKEFRQDYEKKSENLSTLTKKLTKDNPPPFLMRRMKEDHLDGLKEKREIIRKENMPAEQVKAYDSVVQRTHAGVYGKSPMLAITHLKAVSLVPAIAPELNDSELIASSASLIALLKILDEIKARGEKVLIFLASRELQARLIPLLQHRYDLPAPPLLINGAVSPAKRKRTVNDFQSMPAGFAVMLIAPQAGGTGLTITAANNVVHLGRWWNPAVEDQCSDRVYRIGQERDVNIYLPMAIHPRLTSFDETLHDLLTEKRQLSRQVIVPTAFNASDRKKLFEAATGTSYNAECEDNFYRSEEWQRLRYQTLTKYGHRCQKCGAGKESHLHVDHIKPRSVYPELALEPDNLQVLCEPCNLGKSNLYEDDYRESK